MKNFLKKAFAGVFVLAVIALFIITLENLPENKTWLDAVQVFTMAIIALAALKVSFDNHSLALKKTKREQLKEALSLRKRMRKFSYYLREKHGDLLKNGSLEEKWIEELDNSFLDWFEDYVEFAPNKEASALVKQFYDIMNLMGTYTYPGFKEEDRLEVNTQLANEIHSFEEKLLNIRIF
ncbi:MAG: hypothetical protein CMO08_05270 [Thalassospira sp.]|nr:hypothetical protein [Thalassospira sp.]|tara:strand:+ start:4973 stop:5512 length:540 start_codon:yes stop_codon:yes gene_type:complete